MAEKDDVRFVITKPGVLVFGEGLPAGSNIASFFQDETVVQVSCGYDHSAVVCESGRVYTFCGNQDKKRMTNVCTVAEPRLVDTLSTVRVTQAACGSGHTVFLTDKGELYSCGENDCGQLGLGHTRKTSTPILVAGLLLVKKVAAGHRHTMVLSDGGDIWVCGDNSNGQLGLGHKKRKTSFTRVPNVSEAIIDISCGDWHTALVSASQALLLAGCNDSGQLGLGAVENMSSFTRVSVPSTAVAAVSCGYDHTVALGVDGTTWAWGYNDEGQLGTGDSTDRFTPTRMIGLEGQTVSQVIARCNHTAVLTRAGDVFVCGKGTSGELGLGKKNVSVGTLLPKSPGLVVQQVAFAEDYSLLLVTMSIVVPLPHREIEIDGQAWECITDWELSAMQTLKCPVCLKIMCAPIHLCTNGHSLCNACRSDDRTTVCPLCCGQFSAARNLTLERLMADIRLPCPECLLRIPACELGEHGVVCLYRDYDCPLMCGSWRGRVEMMMAHALSAHADQTWPNLPRTFVQHSGLLLTDLLAAHGRLFTLHRGYDGEGRTFRAAVRYVGAPEERHAFKFKITLLIEDMHTTYSRNLCSDIESVEDMFRSSNCVSVKVEFLDAFLQLNSLICQVDIVEVETTKFADKMKALLSAREFETLPWLG